VQVRSASAATLPISPALREMLSEALSSAEDEMQAVLEPDPDSRPSTSGSGGGWHPMLARKVWGCGTVERSPRLNKHDRCQRN
jgi:hypothetical protein